MDQIDELIHKLRNDPTCIMQSVNEVASTTDALPPDLRHFYGACGGVVLFSGAPYVWEIAGPHMLAPTNPEVIGEQVDDDITSSWYIIARQRGDSGALISIDLDAKRLGWCYDSDVEIHGLVGNSPILAFSFTELLLELMNARGQYIFWEREGFVYKGDAYDAVDNFGR